MIKQLHQENLDSAIELIKQVFLKFEAPDYTQEGIDEFLKFLDSKDELNTLCFWGYYENNNLLGVIATRNNGNHISLFFVDENHHGKGIGRKLFDHIYNLATDSVTVKASPYAVEIYKHFGFVPTADMQCKNGIIFIPMTKQKDTD